MRRIPPSRPGPPRTLGFPNPVLILSVTGLLTILTACNPFYVGRLGWEQARILASREPLHQVLTDPATDEVTRGKLSLVVEARSFAIDSLGFRNAGDAYTTLARLPSDTLALVLSAAYRDRLAFHTWWFPIAGRVPYRAYFSEQGALEARAELEEQGMDTYLRPTAAFSTLGWFADPVYSTVLRRDEVGVVETVLHELAHNHLFIPGQGRFNESWANFAGHASAIEFFCRRRGGGPDTVKCRRARDRWKDARLVSGYLMELEGDIRAVYAEGVPAGPDQLKRRDERYARALEEFRTQVRPRLRATSYDFLAQEELNNATLLSRTLYFHRLDDFQRLWTEDWAGNLAGLLAWIRDEAPGMDDPFQLLDREALRTGARGQPPVPAATLHSRHASPDRNLSSQAPNRAPHRDRSQGASALPAVSASGFASS